MSKTIAIAASLATVAVLGGTFAFTQMGQNAAQCGATAVGGQIGGPFTLVNEAGETVTDKDVITEPSLVYFGYTFCPDVCPLDVARNAIAVDILADEGVSVTPVFITIDPARDTPEILTQFTDNFSEKMIGLTGTDAQIAQAAKAYRTTYAKLDDDPEYYLMQHMRFTYLMMPDTGFVEFFRGDDSPEVMAERVACFVDAAA